MMRFLIFIAQMAALGATVLWLTDQPGTARIVWRGTVIETSAAFLALSLVLIAYALHLIWRLGHFLRHGPAQWRLRRQIDKWRQGQDQLTKGLIAIASGDAVAAGKRAVAARKYGGQSAMTLWLQAQAAQLAGDAKAARGLFRALAADPDAAVLGYRGLIAEAKRGGQWDEVDRLAAELQRIKPGLPWLGLIRMESAARRGQWGEAEAALAPAGTAHGLEPEPARRARAALRIAIGREALAAGDHNAALRAVEQAAQQAPGWLPALIALAETLAATAHDRAARRVIDRAWKKTPHPQLAEILRRLAHDRIDAYKQTEQLCRGNANAVDSRLALATAALDADIWGEARRHLAIDTPDVGATQAVYKMLARLEQREKGDDRAAALWLIKGGEAPPDPAWLCRSCGCAHKIWQPVCVHCGAFDSVEWLSPGQSRPVAQVTGGDRGD